MHSRPTQVGVNGEVADVPVLVVMFEGINNEQEPNNLLPSCCTSEVYQFVLVALQMAVALEALADGGVLVGIPRPMAQRIAAYTMMVQYISVTVWNFSVNVITCLVFILRSIFSTVLCCISTENKIRTRKQSPVTYWKLTYKQTHHSPQNVFERKLLEEAFQFVANCATNACSKE